MAEARALVIDDEPDLRELFEMTLGSMDIDVDTAADLAEARHKLASKHYDFCLTDMRLPDGNGLSLIRQVARDYPEMPIAMITAYGRLEDAVTALKYGAFDFVAKPVDLDALRGLVRTAIKLRQDDAEKSGMSPGTTETTNNEDATGPASVDSGSGIFDRMIGTSEPMQLVRKTIAKLARSQAPVMINGPSGTGKELAANLIHDLGPRSENPFVAVNCGAIPPELMESEFFGHRKGSFTGADADKEGLFQSANGGTLFLDEVADLPLNMQVKLLRAIQEKRVRSIGGREEVPIDVRILSASHKPLKPLVESGDFRSDLFFRLNVIELTIPPLSQRRADIPLLVNHFLKLIAEQWGDEPRKLDDSAKRALLKHPFPGNVRELFNILQRAVTLSETQQITADDLHLDQAPNETTDALPADPGDSSLDDYMESIEKRILENALKDARYNKTEAARRLGITFRSFRYKLDKYGIA